MRRDRLARLHGAVDRQAGERVRVIPYAAGGYVTGGPDPDRAAIEIVGEVTDVSKVSRSKSSGANSGKNAELQLGSHAIKFSTDALPWPLAAGDHVVLLDGGGLELKVNRADPLGTGRTIARLERLRKA